MISQYFTLAEFCLLFPSHSKANWYCPKRREDFDGQTCIRDGLRSNSETGSVSNKLIVSKLWGSRRRDSNP
jgi:hypothetical protein